MILSHLFRCSECPKRYMVSYTAGELLTNFWGVHRVIADVEMDYFNHRADCVNSKVEEYLGQLNG